MILFNQRNSSKRILFISEFFSPSTSATAQIAEDLARACYERFGVFDVLTASHGCSCEKYFIHRFSFLSRHSTSIFSKALSGVFFLTSCLIWSILNRNKYDTILIFSNPPFAGLVGVLLRLLLGKRFIFILQDLFPRSAYLTGVLPSRGPLVMFWRLLISLTISHSKATVVLSESMRKRAILEYSLSPASRQKLCVIPNWSVQEPKNLRKEESSLFHAWGLENFFVVQYSGNIGRMHEFLTVLEAARLTTHLPIKYLFIGTGPKRDHLVSYIKKFNLHNVVLHPFQDRTMLHQTLALSDISLVTLIPGAEDTVAPSKVYGILASARPLLLIASSSCELSKFITRSNAGIVIEPGDVQMLVTQLTALLCEPHRLSELSLSSSLLSQTSPAKKASTDKYCDLLAD